MYLQGVDKFQFDIDDHNTSFSNSEHAYSSGKFSVINQNKCICVFCLRVSLYLLLSLSLSSIKKYAGVLQ